MQQYGQATKEPTVVADERKGGTGIEMEVRIEDSRIIDRSERAVQFSGINSAKRQSCNKWMQGVG